MVNKLVVSYEYVVNLNRAACGSASKMTEYNTVIAARALSVDLSIAHVGIVDV